MGSEWLTLDVHNNITQLPLQTKLIQLAQDGAAVLRDIKLDETAAVHVFRWKVSPATGTKREAVFIEQA